VRETKFIEQNKEKWEEYERMLSQKDMDAEKLTDLYIHVTDDLAYSRTYYPNRTVRAYLNGLASRVFQHLSGQEKFPWAQMKHFWHTELPQIVWDSRRAIQFSLVLFIAAFFIGMLSCMIDPEFPRVILGDGYVNMTLENIKKGDPMAVYKSENMFGMSGSIALNNLRVAFFTMILGLVASIGTLFIMLYNGIMVGAFQYLFVQEGVFWDSFLTIWIHGTLEISAIIIAGGAGFVAGSGWLFPGTFSRSESFRLSIVKGFKLFMGLIPIIILAAIFEGYLTRATETPDWIRGAFILVSLGFILWYFVWYPWVVAKRTHAPKETEIVPTKTLQIDTTEIKDGGRIFSEAIAIFMKRFSTSGGISALLSAVFVAVFYLLFILDKGSEIFIFSESSDFWSALFSAQNYDALKRLLFFDQYHAAQYLHLPFIAIISIVSFRSARKHMSGRQIRGASLTSEIVAASILCIGAWCFCFLMQYENYLPTLFAYLIVLPSTGLLAYIAYTGQHELIALFSNFTPLFRLWPTLVSYLYLFMFSYLLFLFMSTYIFDFLVELIVSHSMHGEQTPEQVQLVFMTFIVIWLFYMTISAMMTSTSLLYHSAVECVYAESITEGIEKVGMQKQIRGLPKE
jgi:uncharacterized membrane protein SpoIIM required for sporulation